MALFGGGGGGAIGEAFIRVRPKTDTFGAETAGAVAGARGRIASALGGIGKAGGVALAAGVSAAVAGGGLLTALGGSFDKAFDTIKTGTGATGKALEGLRTSFKNVVRDVPTDFETASAAIAGLNTMTGATGATLERLTKQVLEASRMLGEDGVANAEAYGRALQQWGIDADTGAEKLDGLFKVTQDYGVGLDRLLGHLNKFGPVMQNAGYSIDETAVFFGQLEKAGLQVTRVMPGLNASFRRWATEGKDSREELERTVTAIRDAEDSQKALAIATETFGAEGAQRLTTAIRSGAMSLEDMKTALDGSKGAIEENARETESFGEKWTRIKNRVLVGLQPLATRVFDAIGEGMDRLAPLTDVVIGGIEKIGGAIGKLLSGDAAGAGVDIGRLFGFYEDEAQTAAIIEVLEGVMGAVREFVGNVRSMLPEVGRVFSNVVGAVGPVLGSLIGIVRRIAPAVTRILGGAFRVAQAVIVEVTKVLRDLMPVVQRAGEFLAGVFERAAPVIEGLFGFLADVAAPILGEVAGFLVDVLGVAVEVVAGAFENVLVPAIEAVVGWVQDSLWPVMQGVAGWMADTFGPIVEALADYWSLVLWPALQKVAGFLADTVWPVIQTVAEFIGGTFMSHVELLAGVWSNVLWPALQKVAGFITDTVVPTITGIVETIIRVATGVGEQVDRIVGFVTGIPGRISRTISTLWDGLRDGIASARDWVRDRIDDIVGIITAIGDRIGDVASAIRSPFETAFNAIKDLWNRTVGGFGFTIPWWVPKLSGKEFRIPKMHTGGVVPGLRGTEVPVMLEAGETVRTREQERRLQQIIDELARGRLGAGGLTVQGNLVLSGGREVVDELDWWARYRMRAG